MVATRRGVSQELSVDGGDFVAAPTPEVSTELHPPTPQRLTRSRYKESSQSVVLSDSQLEEPGAAATKSQLVDLSEPLNLSLQRTNKSRSKHETQSDGDISEAESNCSSISGIQIPSVTRTTRSRQIKITYPSDSVTKSKTKKPFSRTEPIAESQEEGEVSEAESCCSSVSGIQMSCTTRSTRSRQTMVKIPPSIVSEPQTEEISDAESWSSGVSVGPSTRRITRSTRLKSQPEIANQNRENDTDVFAEEEPLNRENGTESQLIVISDSECKEKSSSDTEQASSVPSKVSSSLRNRQPTQKKNEFQLEPEAKENTTQIDANLKSSELTEKRKQTKATLLNKATKVTCLDVIDSEEDLDQVLEWEKAGNVRESQFINVGVPQLEHGNDKGSLSFQRQSPMKQSKTISVHQQEDVKTSETSSCKQAAELIEVEEPRESGQRNNDIRFSPIDSDMDDDCKIINVVEADADVNQGELRLQGKTKVNVRKAKRTFNKSDISLILSQLESENSEEEDDLSNMRTRNLKPLSLCPSENELPHVDELFVIDKAPGLDSDKKHYLEDHDVGDAECEEEESTDQMDDEDDFVDEAEDSKLVNSSKPGFILSTSIDPGLNVKDIGGLYICFDVGKQKPDSSTLKKMKVKKKDKKSILSPDFEKKESVPPYSESVQQLKKKRKAERSQTTGDGWFGMKAPEMTEELKNDLKALQMRSAMDPKRFYKKNDRDGFPKYFQVGTVVDNPVDFYHSRIPKKQRKRTIVEELLADSEFRRYNKRKYREIMTEKAAFAAGKKNRKKKKFHK
ncbi:deoxynucleotidyltransferase terminal-interacting protein 2 [Rhinatrema bivittatum]|uniref:deoxynucleotidyltransferase terminal-interacting protein 2 n=1 Tax=Rhinatrema bivittatum TaxID=194408 RepID=UPI00112AA6A7|nr:deoxynucleotidyltransferase terminal-interacting protein 2 [Rhinatrema bivittatum]